MGVGQKVGKGRARAGRRERRRGGLLHTGRSGAGQSKRQGRSKDASHVLIFTSGATLL